MYLKTSINNFNIQGDLNYIYENIMFRCNIPLIKAVSRFLPKETVKTAVVSNTIPRLDTTVNVLTYLSPFPLVSIGNKAQHTTIPKLMAPYTDIVVYSDTFNNICKANLLNCGLWLVHQPYDDKNIHIV